MPEVVIGLLANHRLEIHSARSSFKKRQIQISQSVAFDDLMARVKNPTVNKQAREIQSAIVQRSAGKVNSYLRI